MEYNARKFVQSSYNENDEFAKNIFLDFIKKRGHSIINSEENFKHDVISIKNGVTFYFELEVKIGYPFTSKESFKFNTVSFLGRKKRLHDIHPFYYVVICKETKSALFADSNNIYNNNFFEQVKVNVNDRKGNDGMYRVPKNLCTFFTIT